MPPAGRRLPWFIVALALLAPLLFAAFTDHAWEDYFITLRASRNLVEGNGLVFNAGQRVHTFTSPLGVLLPALCTAVAGANHETAALWMFRLISAGFLAGAVWLLWRRAHTIGISTPACVVLFGLIVADPKLTDFSINGMETALLVWFVVLLWSELERAEGLRVSRLALGFAGLMWTRPDAFILAGALTIPHVIFRRREGGPGDFPARWNALWRGALLAGLIYLPWFAWAWWYYGTPVPHTIIAKSAYTPPVHLHDLMLLPWRVITGDAMLVDLFLPAYWVFGGWPRSLVHIAHALSAVAAFAWVFPRVPPRVRRLSLAVFLGAFYLCSIILFPWYVPPWSVLSALVIALLVDAAWMRAKSARLTIWPSVVRIACAVIVCVQAAQWIAVAWQMRVQQHVVETPVRRAVGEWLHDHARPGDTVFLEPLGYIGYYSQLKTYDFPGLSSPEVVAVVKQGHKSYAAIIAQLRPDWIVLRPAERARPEFQKRPVLADYELAQSWDALPQLNAIACLPGRPWVEFESRYLLFRRKAAAAR